MSKWFRFSIKDIVWLTILVAVIVMWRVEVHKVTRSKNEEIDHYHGMLVRAEEHRIEQVVREHSDYSGQLDSIKAANDKLVEENRAMRKALEEK